MALPLQGAEAGEGRQPRPLREWRAMEFIRVSRSGAASSVSIIMFVLA